MLRVALTVQRGDFAVAADFEVPPGQITVLFGPSGSGKSTLLAGIAGLLPAVGRCAVGPVVWQDDAAGLCLPAHRRRLGFVFQDGRLLPHHDVRGELAFVARRRGSRARVPEVVAACGLEALLHRPTGLLSGGERQRVALARALLADPLALLLDEPLAALDGLARRALLPLVEGAARDSGIPVLYVTHSPEELARLGDQVLPIAAGVVGPPRSVTATLAALGRDSAEGALAVLSGRLVAGGEVDGLSRVTVGAQELLLALSEAERAAADRANGAVRIRVAARDVSVALDAPRRSSILNVLATTIEAIEVIGGDGATEVLVTLALEGQTLLARVSRRSLRLLALEVGQPVHAQVKAVALA